MKDSLCRLVALVACLWLSAGISPAGEGAKVLLYGAAGGGANQELLRTGGHEICNGVIRSDKSTMMRRVNLGTASSGKGVVSCG